MAEVILLVKAAVTFANQGITRGREVVVFFNDIYDHS